LNICQQFLDTFLPYVCVVSKFEVIFFFNFPPFCTKEITLLQSLPTMLSVECPHWLTMSKVVHFTGGIYGQQVCHILKGCPCWNTANCCDIYCVSGTNKMPLIPLVYFYWVIFTHMFQPVIRPSSGWHFCYKITIRLNVSNYSI